MVLFLSLKKVLGSDAGWELNAVSLKQNVVIKRRGRPLVEFPVQRFFGQNPSVALIEKHDVRIRFDRGFQQSPTLAVRLTGENPDICFAPGV
jgi:hypothetical protein